MLKTPRRKSSGPCNPAYSRGQETVQINALSLLLDEPPGSLRSELARAKPIHGAATRAARYSVRARRAARHSSGGSAASRGNGNNWCRVADFIQR